MDYVLLCSLLLTLLALCYDCFHVRLCQTDALESDLAADQLLTYHWPGPGSRFQLVLGSLPMILTLTQTLTFDHVLLWRSSGFSCCVSEHLVR
jgi:hypothetical protein